MAAARLPVLAGALALFVLLIGLAAPSRADDALVDTRWLAAQLAQGAVVVLDVRPPGAFARGHIPGAVHLPLRGGAWLETRYGVANRLTPADHLAAALAGAGIANDSEIVVVSGGPEVMQLAEGARAFWSLRALGHSGLHLLDGGYSAWAAEGRAMAGGPQLAHAPAPYLARSDPGVLATVRQVEDAMDDNNPPIDARDRAAFEGHKVSPLVDEGGTILDAVNLPAAALIAAESGRFLPPAALAARIDRLALPPHRRAVVFSDTGIRAALVWFVLHEILGIEAQLYDGSLAQWAKEDYDMYDSTDGMGGVIGG